MQRQNLPLHSSAFHHIYEIKSANKFLPNFLIRNKSGLQFLIITKITSIPVLST